MLLRSLIGRYPNDWIEITLILHLNLFYFPYYPYPTYLNRKGHCIILENRLILQKVDFLPYNLYLMVTLKLDRLGGKSDPCVIEIGNYEWKNLHFYYFISTTTKNSQFWNKSVSYYMFMQLGIFWEEKHWPPLRRTHGCSLTDRNKM